jgi:hypothetical protein
MRTSTSADDASIASYLDAVRTGVTSDDRHRCRQAAR